MDLNLIAELTALESDVITETPAVIPFEEGLDLSMVPEGVNLQEVTISPLKVLTVNRIAPLILKLQAEDLDKITVNKERAFDPQAPEIFQKYSGVIINIIALGIHNRRGPVPGYLEEFLTVNFTWKDLHILLNAVLFRMGTLNFYASTIEAKKMGPPSLELIARAENLKTWENQK